ncbi:hypothetical protein H8B02_36695 [Bradyrhizobium sp. Pear77]|uniref:hypothetical protein n=1 Tax=Bradyrhizobium altum TaxID=1571202 RepID=UPI001E591C80|nr:hypothetical protein [Bradyrhizobium altum]MCC8958757.1 hypothetical protein [Bradyrhizobium altum]
MVIIVGMCEGDPERPLSRCRSSAPHDQHGLLLVGMSMMIVPAIVTGIIISGTTSSSGNSIFASRSAPSD